MNPQPTVAFQPMQPVGGPPPAAAPAGRKKGLMALLALLVLAALGVGAFFLFFNKDDDKGGGNLDTKAASASLKQVLDAAQTSGAPGQCPFADLDALAAKAPKSLDAVAAAKGTETTSFQTLADKRMLTCVATGTPTSIRILAAEPVDGTFQDVWTKALSGFQIDFKKAEALRGGTIQSYCATAAQTNERSCAVQWFDGDLRLGAVSTAKDANATDVQTWLTDILDDLVAGVQKAVGATSGSTPGT